jgi:hypothetical protein
MKATKHFKSLLSVVISTMAFATLAWGATPTLTLSGQNGTQYTLNIYGDANQTAYLYYHSNSNPSVYTNLNVGTTNASGTLSYVFNTATYNTIGNDSVYVTVNGQNSTLLNLNNPNTAATTTLSLSTISVSLYPGQTTTVSGYNVSGTLSVTSSNPNIATVSVNGANLTITGQNTGSEFLTITGTNIYGQPVTATIYVTVNTVNQNGPYTVSVCGYNSSNAWVCQNVTVNTYADYLFLNGLLKTIPGSVNNPGNVKCPNPNMTKRIDNINKQIQKRISQINKRISHFR